ncbi:hypothetical protein DACRYDRAFT_19720 [Dacryopinax primogenitus]|uniref:Uncharacterized protein n=1 Tax=Dacryopinax primogenitus (strain DJM 731) TaxID=1858805 RepID=M5G8X8_DACPD|nr:uncharacterized protein DACRYDRAFT_19720 [Dacryopinax primogenitus]EJU06661.1 hypothetical protein DACRYDRAFT_19720 [Dacryopinax primogenitus]
MTPPPGSLSGQRPWDTQAFPSKTKSSNTARAGGTVTSRPASGRADVLIQRVYRSGNSTQLNSIPR